MADLKKLIKKMEAFERYVNNDLKTIIGVEAVKHFKKSFDDEGFTDKTLKKWKEVERRKADSPWYGFKYGTKGVSSAAATGKIMTGNSDLADSIQWELTNTGVNVSAKTPYAEVQNKGGTIKVFGKKSVELTARPFMGESEVLRKKILKEVKKDLDRILK